MISGPDHSSKNLADWLNRDREELYDLVNDPHETRNLANEPLLSRIRDDLSRKCDHWMESTKDPVMKGPITPNKSQYEKIKKRTGETAGVPLGEILGFT